jgi:hypothetical protein
MRLLDYGIMEWKVRPPNGHSPFRTAFNFSLFCQPVSFTAGWPAQATVMPSYILRTYLTYLTMAEEQSDVRAAIEAVAHHADRREHFGV